MHFGLILTTLACTITIVGTTLIAFFSARLDFFWDKNEIEKNISGFIEAKNNKTIKIIEHRGLEAQLYLSPLFYCMFFGFYATILQGFVLSCRKITLFCASRGFCVRFLRCRIDFPPLVNRSSSNPAFPDSRRHSFVLCTRSAASLWRASGVYTKQN